MCKLLYTEGKENRVVKSNLVWKNFIHTSKTHGKDGWGIASMRKSSWEIMRRPQNVYSDSYNKKVINTDFYSKKLVGHLRLASVGKKSFVNTHPFEYNGWIFCHNGTIQQHIPDSYHYQVKGLTDSERFFGYLIDKLIIPDKLNTENIIDLVADYDPNINFILSNKDRTYIYHSMMYPIHYLITEKMIIVTTRPIFNSSRWGKMEYCQLMEIKKGKVELFLRAKQKIRPILDNYQGEDSLF